MRRKRLKYESCGDEDAYVLKCQLCKHSYVRQDSSDELRCGCRGKCNFEPATKADELEVTKHDCV